jgi:hypothetical protein
MATLDVRSSSLKCSPAERFRSTMPSRRTSVNWRERCSESTSWGSLVRAQYRPSKRPANRQITFAVLTTVNLRWQRSAARAGREGCLSLEFWRSAWQRSSCSLSFAPVRSIASRLSKCGRRAPSLSVAHCMIATCAVTFVKMRTSFFARAAPSERVSSQRGVREESSPCATYQSRSTLPRAGDI